MSFIALAGTMLGTTGAIGIGTTMLGGAMMGATTGAIGNVIKGNNVFDNFGQNLLIGGAGAGIVSGLGSAMGGKTLETLTAEAAQPGLDAATKNFAENAVTMPSQEAIDAGSKSITDRFGTFENPILTPAEPLPLPVNSSNIADINNASYGDSPLATKPDYYDKLYQQTSGLTPPKATFMKNPANYMVQNPSTVAGAVTGIASMLKQPPPVAGLQDKTGYSPQYTFDPKTQRYIAAAPMSYTYKGAEGGEVPSFADGVYIPQSENIRTNIYGSNAGPIGESGKKMYKNVDKYAGLKAQLDKMSPTMLSKLSQSGTDSIVQAAATTELYDRANAANSSYMDQPTMQAAQGGIMGFGIGGSTSATATAGGPPPSSAGEHHWYDFLKGGMSGDINSGGPSVFDQLLSQNPEMVTKLRGPDNYSYNPANQTYSGQGMSAVSSTPAQYSFDPTGQSYAPKMAAGGIASLPNEYAAGGKLLQGPGDGMSDSIPAVIKGARPQRAALAQGEFVIPADVVSHLGNGSTDAGAKRLYAMMDKIRHARTGTKKQGRQINPANFMPA